MSSFLTREVPLDKPTGIPTSLNNGISYYDKIIEKCLDIRLSPAYKQRKVCHEEKYTD